MLDYVRRIIGSVDITENRGVISIIGIPARLIEIDIDRSWKTTRITKNMFLQITSSRISIPSFFALDFEYMLREILEMKGSYSNKAVIKSVLTELREKTWLRNINATDAPSEFDFREVNQVKFKLLDHQKKFLAWYDWVKPRYNLRGILLTAAAGGGKTVSSIAACCAYKSDINIVIAPNNAIWNVWHKTLMNDMVEPQKVWVAASKVDPDKDTKWFIFHYEALDKALEMLNIFKGRVSIVLDESHNFNDLKSLRTQRLIELCDKTKSNNIIWASGTPIKAMGNDAIPLIRCIDPLFTEKAEIIFRKIYGKDATRANDVLSNRLGIISYKTPKNEFMADKPVEQNVKVKIPNGKYYTLDAIKERMAEFIKERAQFYKQNKPKYDAIYDEAIRVAQAQMSRKEKDDFVTYQNYVSTFKKYGFDAATMGPMAMFCNNFEKTVIMPKLPDSIRRDFREAKSVVKYVDLKIRGECLGGVLGKERIQAHVEMIKHIDYSTLITSAKKKTLIFSSYVEVVDQTVAHLKTLNFKPMKVTAETNKQLTSIISTFTNDPNWNPLVATYQSLSTAVPIIAANNVITTNQPFRSHEMEQAISRAYRLGQDETVYVWHILLDTGEAPNISTRSADIMEWSKQQVDAIMGFTSRGDLDISLESLVAVDKDIDEMDKEELRNEAMAYVAPAEPDRLGEHHYSAGGMSGMSFTDAVF